MTVHIVNAPMTGEPGGPALFGRVIYEFETRTLCGKLVRKRKAGVVVENLATIAIDSPTIRQRSKNPKVPQSTPTYPGSVGLTDRDRKVCSGCLQLARMTPDARAATMAQAEAKKAEAFSKLKAKKSDADAIKRVELEALIEKSRVDALACYDGWLSEPRRVLKRCGERMPAQTNWNAIAGYSTIQVGACCTLEAGHLGGHTSKAEPAPDVDEVLDAALKAYKIENPKSRGDRLWVFFSSSNQRGRSMSERNVVCRFCHKELGEGLTMGIDYTDYTFYPPGEGEPTLRDVPGPRAPCGLDSHPVNVRDHTVTCALKYLARIPNRNDGLPEVSFVLDLNDDAEEHAP